MNSFAVILSFYCCWFTTSSSIWTWEFEAILFPSSSFAMIAHRIVTSERGGQGMPSLPSRKLTGRHEALRSWIIDRFDNRHPHHRRYTGVLCQPLPPPPNSPPTSLWPLKAPPVLQPPLPAWPQPFRHTQCCSRLCLLGFTHGSNRHVPVQSQWYYTGLTQAIKQD